MGRRNHVVVSVLCVVVTGSVGWSRTRQLEGQRPLQQPHPQEQQGLGPAWKTKNEENLRRWRSDDRAREKERQANDWRTFNEKRIKQAKTGLFIQNLFETEHPGDYERAGIFILESRRDLGRLYEMAPVRIAQSFVLSIF